VASTLKYSALPQELEVPESQTNAVAIIQNDSPTTQTTETENAAMARHTTHTH